MILLENNDMIVGGIYPSCGITSCQVLAVLLDLVVVLVWSS